MTAVTAPVHTPTLSPTKLAAHKIETKLVEMEERLKAFCAPGMTPAAVRHAVMMSLGANPRLLEAKWESVVMSAVVITQWGLEIGQTAYIIPYKGVATPVADYKGLIELMMATRLIKHVNAKEIREADHFEYNEGDRPLIIHRPDWRDKNGPIIGAYCSIPTIAGGVIQEVMNVDEIEAIRRNSHQWKGGPLAYWYARKCPIRRAAKSAPKSVRLQQLLRFENDAGDPSEEAMDLISGGDMAALNAGAPVYDQRESTAPIAQPSNGYGDDEVTLL